MCRELSALGLDADILFCDDNSPDGTGEIIDRLARELPRVHAMHRPGKLGIGSAHMDGLAHAYNGGYQTLLTMDCDFTHQPDGCPPTAGECAGASGDGGLALHAWQQPAELEPAAPLADLPGPFPDGQFAAPAPGCDRRPARLPTRPNPARAFRTWCAPAGTRSSSRACSCCTATDFAIHEMAIELPARTYGHSKMTLRETGRSATRLLKLFRAQRAGPEPVPALPADRKRGGPARRPAGLGQLLDAGPGDEPHAFIQFIASVYRRVAIRRQLDFFIHKHFTPGARLLHAGCGERPGRSAPHRGDEDHGRGHFAARAGELSPQQSARRGRAPGGHPAPGLSSRAASTARTIWGWSSISPGRDRSILSEMGRVLKPGGKIVIFWPHRLATSVWVLNGVHWLLNLFSRKPVRLHPPEISLLESARRRAKQWSRRGSTWWTTTSARGTSWCRPSSSGRRKRRDRNGSPAARLRSPVAAKPGARVKLPPCLRPPCLLRPLNPQRRLRSSRARTPR